MPDGSVWKSVSIKKMPKLGHSQPMAAAWKGIEVNLEFEFEGPVVWEVSALDEDVTIEAQTGWKRSWNGMSAPKAICQDIEVLVRVSVYTYDASNEAFLDYSRDRLGWDPRRADCGFSRWLELDAMSESEYRQTEECCFAQWVSAGQQLSSDRSRYRWDGELRSYIFSAAEVELSLKVRRIQKGHLQDCWELFCKFGG